MGPAPWGHQDPRSLLWGLTSPGPVLVCPPGALGLSFRQPPPAPSSSHGPAHFLTPSGQSPSSFWQRGRGGVGSVGTSKSGEVAELREEQGYGKYHFTRKETTAHYRVTEVSRCRRHHRGQDSQDAQRGWLSLGLVAWFWKVLSPLLSTSGPRDCFLWREEAEGTAFLPAADVDSFLLVDGGEGCLEASELISGKPKTFGIPRACCH